MRELIQGTEEWLALRKSKVTATDAAIVMGMNPWKNVEQLYKEKTEYVPRFTNASMERGTRLEPVARAYYSEKTNREMNPVVLIKEWAMASLDGISADGHIVEIKCPGEKVHKMALDGQIPGYYYPQMQHQMYVADASIVDYMSFDGENGVIIPVERNDEFIEKMITKEKIFYDCLQTKTPPKLYDERNDESWITAASLYTILTKKIKTLEIQAEKAKADLILLAGSSEARGAGISLSKVERKGTVDYSKIPELKGIDLEVYRKPASSYWKVCEV